MDITTTFYTIIAYNHCDTIRFETNVLDYEYALTIFKGLVLCIDVKEVVMIDGTTGEVVHHNK